MPYYTPNERPFINHLDVGRRNLGLESAWMYAQGKGVKIAILSTGIVQDGRYLSRVTAGRNFMGRVADYDNYFEEMTIPYDHVKYTGSFMANIIALGYPNDLNYNVGSPSYGGIAPQAELIIGKIRDSDKGYNAGIATVAIAIDWAVAQGANIILLDCHTNYPGTSLPRAVDNAVKKGVFVVAGGVNSSSIGVIGTTTVNNITNIFPLDIPDVISFQCRALSYLNMDNSTAANGIVGGVFPAKMNSDFGVIDNFTGYIYNSNSPYGMTATFNIASQAMAGAIGAGVLALMIEACREANIPLTNKEEFVELMKDYTRPLRNSATNKNVTHGIIHLGANPMPNASDKKVYVSNAEILADIKLSQIPVSSVREQLRIKTAFSDKFIANLMQQAKSYIAAETFRTLEELDEHYYAITVFYAIMQELLKNPAYTTQNNKENELYKMMIKRLRKNAMI